MPVEPHRRDVERPLTRRLAWFVGLWVASIVFLGTVAMVIKLWLGV